jgi:integrase
VLDRAIQGRLLANPPASCFSEEGLRRPRRGRSAAPRHPLARHTVAAELRRVAGIDAASQALGHADLNTTLGIYGHRDQTDLETAMDAYANWLEQQRENEIVPPEADR